MAHRLGSQRGRVHKSRECWEPDRRIKEWLLQHLAICSKMLTLKTLFVRMNGPDGDPGHCISNAEYFIETTAMRLPPDPNAPLRHKFRGPAFDSHIKCWRRRRFRLLDRSFFDGRWFWALFFQDHVDQAQHISPVSYT